MSQMKPRILIVEDDRNALRFAQYTLEQEGYTVTTAVNGLEGLRKAEGENPDLIVLDVMLPGMNGFEVCQKLKADQRTAKIPILMMTAKARESDKETGLNLGADDYLTKPASPDQLVASVVNLLARSGIAPSREEGST